MRYDIANFTNIDEETFVGKWGGEEYVIEPGETKAFPVFLVEHFTKHLIDKILLRQGVENYNDEVKRRELAEKIKGEIVIEAEKEEKKTEGRSIKEEVEKVQEEFEELKEKREIELREKKLKALEKAREAKKLKSKKE